MRAGFIGAGKVGFSLGKYLKENGVEITGYFSKSPESAKSAADFTNTKLYKSIENILSDSDTLFITVPDGQISKVWDYMKNLDIKNKNICHCSGSIWLLWWRSLYQGQAALSLPPSIPVRLSVPCCRLGGRFGKAPPGGTSP